MRLLGGSRGVVGVAFAAVRHLYLSIPDVRSLGLPPRHAFMERRAREASKKGRNRGAITGGGPTTHLANLHAPSSLPKSRFWEHPHYVEKIEKSLESTSRAAP